MARSRVDKLVDAWESALRRAFLQSFADIRGSAQIGQITARLERGDIEGALKAVGIDAAKFRPYDKAITNMFESGGQSLIDSLPVVRLSDGFRVQFQFDIRNPAAEKYLSERSSSQIKQITDGQVNMVREQLMKGVEGGSNPREVALNVVGRVGASGRREGGFIGLTSSQAEWVNNYREELASENPAAALQRNLRDARFDKSVIKAVETGEPISQELQDKMVTAYQNRALRYRAEAIARTEAMASLHESQDQAMAQAIETDAIKQDNVTEIWHTTHDKRARDSHVEMDEQEIKYGEMFVTGNGNYLAYPGDPDGVPEEVINCRCWREFNVDFLAGVE